MEKSRLIRPPQINNLIKILGYGLTLTKSAFGNITENYLVLQHSDVNTRLDYIKNILYNFKENYYEKYYYEF